MPAQHQIRMPGVFQRPQDRRAGEPGMSGDVNPGVALHRTINAGYSWALFTRARASTGASGADRDERSRRQGRKR